MMAPPLLRTSAQEALNLLKSYWGTSWPNPWWPTGVPAYNDCAACMSWCLFGLNGNQPYYTYVSQIQALWPKHAGAAGMQPGDVIAFDWQGDGDPDHTEMCVSIGGGQVTSRGTNSSGGDNLIDRTRSTSQVLSYVRPPYSAATPATQTGDEDMRVISVPNGTIALIGEYEETRYTSASGGQGFSIGCNVKAWGQTTGLTEDEVTTLTNESIARRNGLVNSVAAQVIDQLEQLIEDALGNVLGSGRHHHRRHDDDDDDAGLDVQLDAGDDDIDAIE
jgi:hypothetical protein